MSDSTEKLKEALDKSGIRLTEAQKDLLVQYATAMATIDTLGEYPEGNPAGKDPITAFDAMSSAAGYGIADAQYLLGLMYEKGHGTPVDYQEAFGWYQQAAEQGHPSAQNNLGLMYVMGKGVPQDNEKAFS
ncbi:MAG: sel1 repeat family protein [Oxalobacter sp.]|nr:sel1 repeat family protein [Oxalobacter sp.]